MITSPPRTVSELKPTTLLAFLVKLCDRFLHFSGEGPTVLTEQKETDADVRDRYEVDQEPHGRVPNLHRR